MKTNLFAAIPQHLPEELFEELLHGGPFRLERIVSCGHHSPPGFWYDQPQAEWILLLSGGARLTIEGEALPVVLGPGDHLLIPAHVRHRVEWTAPDHETIWLAIHFNPPLDPA